MLHCVASTVICCINSHVLDYVVSIAYVALIARPIFELLLFTNNIVTTVVMLKCSVMGMANYFV